MVNILANADVGSYFRNEITLWEKKSFFEGQYVQNDIFVFEKQVCFLMRSKFLSRKFSTVVGIGRLQVSQWKKKMIWK